MIDLLTTGLSVANCRNIILVIVSCSQCQRSTRTPIIRSPTRRDDNPPTVAGALPVAVRLPAHPATPSSRHRRSLSLLQGSCSCRFGHAGRSPCLRLLLTTHVLQDRLFSQLPHLSQPLTQHVRFEHARFEKPCPTLSGAFCRNLSVYDISIVLAHKYLGGISVIPSPAIPTTQTQLSTDLTL